MDDDYQVPSSLSVFLSRPRTDSKHAEAGPNGNHFDYDYKDGRPQGYRFDDYEFLPVKSATMDPATANRLQSRLPMTWKTMDDQKSTGSGFIQPSAHRLFILGSVRSSRFSRS